MARRTTDEPVHGDLVELLGEQLQKFSYAERLRLAADLLDDAAAGRNDRVTAVRHARHILGLIDQQLLAELRKLQ